MTVTEEKTGAAPAVSGSEPAAELIAKARAAFDAGRKDEAFDKLDKAVSSTADPMLLREVHALAKLGYEEAGFIGKHTMWGGLVKAVERALALEDQRT